MGILYKKSVPSLYAPHLGILFIIFIAGILLACIHTAIQPKAICVGCNIVVLNVDLIRADALPCYGYIYNTTPHLCRFANRSIRFTNAHSQSTRTLPNEASLFTSLYQSNHGIDNDITDRVHPSTPTLSGLFKQAGYRTVFIGGNTSRINVPLYTGLEHTFDVIYTAPTDEENDLTALIQRAQDALESRKPSDPPFFIYLYSEHMHDYHLSDVLNTKAFVFDPTFKPIHIPNLSLFTELTRRNAIEKLRYFIARQDGSLPSNRYQKILDQLTIENPLHVAKAAFLTLPQKEQLAIHFLNIYDILDANNSTHQRYLRNLYDNRLFALDEKLAPFWEFVTKTNNTMTVFTSDHGESFGENNLLGHSKTPYDAVTHVPFIMHVPKLTPRIIEPIAQLIDIFPTLLALTGVRIPDNINGHSLAPALIGNKLEHPAGTYAITEVARAMQQSLRTDQWRLVIRHGKPPYPTLVELYDLSSDPKQNQNIADQLPDTVKALTKQMQTIIGTSGLYPQISRDLDEIQNSRE